MLRTLLALEDYGELMFLQTLLKKTGLDAEGIQNPAKFGDAILSLNPELIIMNGYGRKIKGVELSEGVHKTREQPRIILLYSTGQLPAGGKGVDRWFKTPSNPAYLLDLIAELHGLDPAILRDKYARIPQTDVDIDTPHWTTAAVPPPPKPVVGVVLQPSSLDAKARAARYKEALAMMPAFNFETFDLSKVKEQVRSLRLSEDPEGTADLERERQEFVRQLFRKKDE